MKKLYLLSTVLLTGLVSNTAMAQLNTDPFGLFDVVAEPKSNVLAPEQKLIFQNGVATMEERDTTTLQWQKGSRITGILDSHGNQTLLKMEEADSSGNYAQTIKIEQTLSYNGTHQITSFERTINSDGTASIVSTGNLTYDGSGKYLPIKGTFTYDTLTMNTLDSIVYDGSGKMSERIQAFVMEVMGMTIVQPQSRKTFSYSGNDLSSVVTYSEDNGSWVEDERVVLANDGSGNIIARLLENYNDAIPGWEPEQLDSFYYTSSNLTKYISKRYNGTSWDVETNNEYVYSGSKLDYFIQMDNEDGLHKIICYYTGNKIDSAVGYPSNGAGGWLSAGAMRVMFSTPVGISKVKANINNINVYPNPATDIINFAENMNGAQVMVYNLTGQTMLTQTLDSNQLDVSSLKTGIYFVQLSLNGETYRSKISIK